jgi:hypothetical protein
MSTAITAAIEAAIKDATTTDAIIVEQVRHS